MYKTTFQIRTRYAETDQMGYVYYGNYATYFEVARVEALRSLGLSYREMEEQGVMLPVLESTIKYIRPATYDELLTIHTAIETWPGVRLVFHHEIYNEKGELINKASITLVFINKENMKPRSATSDFLAALKPYFKEQN